MAFLNLNDLASRTRAGGWLKKASVSQEAAAEVATPPTRRRLAYMHPTSAADAASIMSQAQPDKEQA